MVSSMWRFRGVMAEKKKTSKTVLKKFTDELIKKIDALPIEKRLQEHLEWMILYRERKKRPTREDVQKKMLHIADDIRFWELQLALENEDFEKLNAITKEIYSRYDDKTPKLRGEEKEQGGVVLLPAIQEVDVGKAVQEEKKDNMATASRTPD